MIVRAAAMLAALGMAAALPPSAAGQVRLQGADGPFTMGVTSWRDMPFRTVVRQQYDFSCGSAALATLLTYHYGRPTTEADTFRSMYAAGDQAKIRRAGFSLLDMKRYLQSVGYTADGFRMPLDAVSQGDAPVIALVQTGRYRHFVVIKGVRGDAVLLGDPAAGVRSVPRAEFEKAWNGVVFAIRGAPAAHGFNQASEWRVRQPAPMGLWSEPLSADALTREMAPLYQITPVIDVNPASF